VVVLDGKALRGSRGTQLVGAINRNFMDAKPFSSFFASQVA